MASGDTLFVLSAENSSPPSTTFATEDEILDASTPPMVIRVLDFGGASNESMDWFVTVPSHYAGTTGFTFSYKYATDGADADLVEMEFRALILDDLDVLTGDLGIDAQTAVAIQDTPPATPTDKLSYSTTGALAKADMGTPSPGDRMVIRATRDTAAATNTDDLQLLEIYVIET